MKAFAVFGLLVSFFACSGCSHLQRAHNDVAVVEFERREDNGTVNLVPCTLVVSDSQRVTLSGGERAVISVAPGSFYVTAFSVDPYSPHSGATAWRSARTRFRVASGETIRVLIEPASSGSTYTGGWIIQAANHELQRTRRSHLDCIWASSAAGSLSTLPSL